MLRRLSVALRRFSRYADQPLSRSSVIPMEHWRQAYLGMRSIPHTQNQFEPVTFFTFSAKERALINARRKRLTASRLRCISASCA